MSEISERLRLGACWKAGRKIRCNKRGNILGVY